MRCPRLSPLLLLLLAALVAGCATQRPASQLSADSRLHVADAAAAAGDDDLAASLYAAAAANAPHDTAVQLRAAAALAKVGKISQPRQVLARRLQAAPDDLDAVRARAGLDLGEGRIAEAVAALDGALATRPEDPATLADKGVALDLQAQHAAAQVLYRRALRAAPNDPAICNDLALSLLLQGRIHEGIAVLAPLEDAPSLPVRARATLALLYALDGQGERSRSVLGHDLPDGYVAEVAKAVNTGRSLPSS